METLAITGLAAASLTIRQPRRASLDLSVSHRLIAATTQKGTQCVAIS